MIGALTAANIALNRMVPHGRSREIPANLAAAAMMLVFATDRGSAKRSLAYITRNSRRGVVAGMALGAPIGTVLTAAAFVPATRRFFHDDRIAGVEAAAASYQFFARIPIATALCEEVIFRIAVPAVLARRRSALESELLAAALFGLWHVLPSIDRLHTNPGTASVHGQSPMRQAGIVGATVGGTAVAGFGLSKLRDASGSIIAPIIAHAAINGGGFLGGWLSSRANQRKDG